MGKASSPASIGSNSILQLGSQNHRPGNIIGAPHPALGRKPPIAWVKSCNRNTDMILEGGLRYRSAQVISYWPLREKKTALTKLFLSASGRTSGPYLLKVKLG